MHEDRDAWLDDVRRWYYGGTPPAGEQPPGPTPLDAAWARRGEPACEPAHERKETR
ncbi:hypothetical protein [Rubrivivax gelatinosus]|uniref:Uncharacterized protein n=1 Tax=Rubrivivax gelatinosus TaxID=28068 RepID=A0A4R2MDF1_RUBGE|nr:hypothetical protein [Rubrivivax gelatinosus]TCP04640.1 hypothetical protein EV684_102401 [Rubrivivax gelatinosus]